MVNQEILEGLRHALERGSSLENAMLSFWRSGYKTEEIEEAAQALVSHPSQEMSHPDKEIPRHMKEPVGRPALRGLPLPADIVHYAPATKPAQPAKEQEAIPSAMPAEAAKPPIVPAQPAQPAARAPLAAPIKPAAPKPEPTPEERKQLVSKYEGKTKAKGRFTIVLLIIILIIFVAMLAGVIIFKDELVQFFNNLFS